MRASGRVEDDRLAKRRVFEVDLEAERHELVERVLRGGPVLETLEVVVEAAPDPPRALVHDGVPARLGDGDGGGQSRRAGADDVNGRPIGGHDRRAITPSQSHQLLVNVSMRSTSAKRFSKSRAQDERAHRLLDLKVEGPWRYVSGEQVS